MTQNQKHPGHRCRIAWTPAPAPASVGNDAWQWRRRQHPKRVTTRRLATWKEWIWGGRCDITRTTQAILLLLHERTKAFHERRDGDVTVANNPAVCIIQSYNILCMSLSYESSRVSFYLESNDSIISLPWLSSVNEHSPVPPSLYHQRQYVIAVVIYCTLLLLHMKRIEINIDGSNEWMIFFRGGGVYFGRLCMHYKYNRKSNQIKSSFGEKRYCTVRIKEYCTVLIIIHTGSSMKKQS